jgi:dienelactone hydrolase
MISFRFTLLLLFFLKAITTAAQSKSMEDYFHFYKSDIVSVHPHLILLLPGSGGLTVFDDSTFYHRKAALLQSEGFDVLLIDYKAAYDVSKEKIKATTGEKIFWVIKKAYTWAEENSFLTKSGSSSLVGWSLAGEGVITLLKDTAFIRKSRIKSVALFYPSSNEAVEINSSIPLLIQAGEKDKIAKPEKLVGKVLKNGNTKLVVYPDCYHGFDIETIREEKSIRFPPVVGKKHIFLYNKGASDSARQLLLQFLHQ